MIRHNRSFDLVFIWFGDTHATVATRTARLLRKPSIVVLGGYDVSDVPGYGFLATPRGAKLAGMHFRRATRIVAVSQALRQKLVERFPDVASKAEVIYGGVDPERFRPDGPRERRVLSVATVERWERAWIKGWDRVAAVARSLPDVRFDLVGATPELAARLDPPANLGFRGPLPRDELIPQYQRAAVYLQASRSEGFPNAVLEAMGCECVPVVTAVGGMPEAVGDAGYVVADDSGLESALRKALETPELGARARQRVVERFSLAARERALVRLIHETAG